MARRYSRAKRYYRKASFGLGGVLPPVLGGVADKFLNNMLPVKGVGATAVGFAMHNSTIKAIGLYEIGASLPGLIGFGNGGTNGGFL